MLYTEYTLGYSYNRSSWKEARGCHCACVSVCSTLGVWAAGFKQRDGFTSTWRRLLLHFAVLHSWISCIHQHLESQSRWNAKVVWRTWQPTWLPCCESDERRYHGGARTKEVQQDFFFFLTKVNSSKFCEVTGRRINSGAGLGLEVPCVYKFYEQKKMLTSYRNS